MRALNLAEMDYVAGGDANAQYGGTRIVPHYVLGQETYTDQNGDVRPLSDFNGYTPADVPGFAYDENGNLYGYRGEFRNNEGVTVSVWAPTTHDVLETARSVLSHIENHLNQALNNLGGGSFYGSIGADLPFAGIDFYRAYSEEHGWQNYYNFHAGASTPGAALFVGYANTDDLSGGGSNMNGGYFLGGTVSAYLDTPYRANGKGEIGVGLALGAGVNAGYTFSQAQVDGLIENLSDAVSKAMRSIDDGTGSSGAEGAGGSSGSSVYQPSVNDDEDTKSSIRSAKNVKR